jgi:hypothetical protein
MDISRAKDIKEWADESIEEFKEDPDHTAWYDLDDYIRIAMGWSGGFDDDYEDYDIVYPNHPEYHLMLKICGDTDYLNDYEYMNMPYDPDSGEVWDTEIPASISLADAEWLIEQYNAIVKELGYKVTVAFNGTEKTYDTDCLDKDDAEEEAFDLAYSDLSILGDVHEDSNGDYYADVIFDGNPKTAETYYETHFQYEYPSEAENDILTAAFDDIVVISVKANLVW